MAGNLPKSLTIEEAVALMVNLESLPKGKSIEEHLLDIYEDAGITHDEAKNNHDPAYVIELLDRHRIVCKNRLNLANAITRSLNHEVTNTIDDEGSLLNIASDSSVTIKLTTESIREWALKLFYISISHRTVEPKSQRSYKSTYLDILDHTIAEHWNSFDLEADDLPKNEVIQLWMKETYPKVKISNVVAGAICTIIRPDEFKSK